MGRQHVKNDPRNGLDGNVPPFWEHDEYNAGQGRHGAGSSRDNVQVHKLWLSV